MLLVFNFVLETYIFNVLFTILITIFLFYKIWSVGVSSVKPPPFCYCDTTKLFQITSYILSSLINTNKKCQIIDEDLCFLKHFSKRSGSDGSSVSENLCEQIKKFEVSVTHRAANTLRW